MEHPPNYLSLFVIILLPLLLLKLLRKRGVGNVIHLLPGPWRLPIIGSLHHLVGSPLTHSVLADLACRLDAPLMYVKLGEVDVVVVSSPDAAREMMRTHDLALATRPRSHTVEAMAVDGEGLVYTRYSPLWRQLRKICIVELLSTRCVKSFRHVREEEVGCLVATVVKAAAGGEAVNLSERISRVITDSSIRSMLGDKFKKTDEFLKTIRVTVKLLDGFNLCDMFPSSWLASFVSGTAKLAKENHGEMVQLMDYAIKQHEEAVRDGGATEDLVDVLLRIQKEGGLEVPIAMGNIKAVIRDLFGAGSDTATTTLQWAMSELMRNPNVMQKAQAEVREKLQGKSKVTEDDLGNLKYLKLVIKETMRLHPPVALIPRETMEPCKILGYDIPKGTAVMINVWAISRDPKHWEDPMEFKPERFESGVIDFKGTNFEYIPFGAGRRICPGMIFAQANMEIVLATLLYQFDWKLPRGVEPNELDMTEDMGLTVKRKKDLYLHAMAYKPTV